MANVLLEPLARPAFEAKIQVMLRAAQAQCVTAGVTRTRSWHRISSSLEACTSQSAVKNSEAAEEITSVLQFLSPFRISLIDHTHACELHTQQHLPTNARDSIAERLHRQQSHQWPTHNALGASNIKLPNPPDGSMNHPTKKNRDFEPTALSKRPLCSVAALQESPTQDQSHGAQRSRRSAALAMPRNVFKLSF